MPPAALHKAEATGVIAAAVKATGSRSPVIDSHRPETPGLRSLLRGYEEQRLVDYVLRRRLEGHKHALARPEARRRYASDNV